MTFKRFIEIWQYRYHKCLSILASVYYWTITCLGIKISKLFNPNTYTIGVLLAEHFGDIVACEPISREIKRLYPHSKVYWIVKKPYRELLDFNPNIDFVIEEYSVFYAMLLIKFNPFDSFHNCHLSGLRRYDYLRTTLQNSRADSLNIFTNNYFDKGNILEVFAEVGGLPVLKDSPRIYIPKKVQENVRNLVLPAKMIVLHCHSNFSPKDWQVYHWQRLVLDLVTNFAYEVIEIGLKSNLLISHPKYHNFCGKYSLLETAEIIKKAQYFIGIDSGPAHFANAVGTYGFLLFGKLGDFENYMPYSGSFQDKSNAAFIVKQGEPCSELGYEEVWDVISSKILKEK